MKQLLFSISASAFILVGCGGGSGHEHNNNLDSNSSSSIVATSSSSSSAVAVSSSSSSVVATSSSLSSSSIQSSASVSSAASSTSSAIPFTLSSTSFTSGDSIPIKYSCFSSETSVQLQWDITSDAVKGFALIMEDYDAIKLVGHPYVHWNIFNIPADTRQIAEGATLHAMPAGSVEGLNDDGLTKYSGPCPPEGTGTHHYFFALYALNKANLGAQTNKTWRRSDFETQFASSIIQKVEISGSYFYK